MRNASSTSFAARAAPSARCAAATSSGAVVEALGVRALAIGPEIAPGVPWTRALGDRPLWLALKSGHFGGDDFFARASATL